MLFEVCQSRCCLSSESEIISADSVKQTHSQIESTGRGVLNCRLDFKYSTNNKFVLLGAFNRCLAVHLGANEDVAGSVVYYERKVFHQRHRLSFFFVFRLSQLLDLVESNRFFSRVSSRPPGPNQAAHCLLWNATHCLSLSSRPPNLPASFSDYSLV